jgi:CDP-diglyceride synthetase
MTQELKLRIISGLILAVVVLFATWQGGFAFDVVAALIGVLVYYEWTTITGIANEDKPGWIAGWIVQTLLVLNMFYGHPHYAMPASVVFRWPHCEAIPKAVSLSSCFCSLSSGAQILLLTLQGERLAGQNWRQESLPAKHGLAQLAAQ